MTPDSTPPSEDLPAQSPADSTIAPQPAAATNTGAASGVDAAVATPPASASTSGGASAASPSAATEAPAPVAEPARSDRDKLGAAVLLFALAAMLVAGVSLVIGVLLWQKLSTVQEQLARQSMDTGANAVEARTVARQSQEAVAGAANRLSVIEARVAELNLQRSQLDALMQGLARTSDESLVADLESSLRMAQEQAQLTGSLAPVLAALQGAEQRLLRSTHPRAAGMQRAITRDMARIKAATVTDTPALLAHLDELIRQSDDMPVLNALPGASDANAAPKDRLKGNASSSPEGQASNAWWARITDSVWRQAQSLVRVSKIETPEAALLTPEQDFFVHENLKLRLLNARMGVLARQPDAVRGDLQVVSILVNKYFNPASRRTQAFATNLQQIQGQVRNIELPRIDETLAALASVSGR